MTFKCNVCDDEFESKSGVSAHRTIKHGRPLDDKEELKKLHWEENLTLKEIGKRKDCSTSLVSMRMDEFDLETRDSSRMKKDLGLTKEFIREKYVEEELSTPEISQLKSCSETAVNNRIEEYGFEKRDIGESNRIDFGLTKELLEEEYIDKGKNISQIAKENNASRKTVQNRMNEHEVETRDSDEFGTPGSNYHMDSQGYECWREWENRENWERGKSTTKVSVHQLLACLNNDPHEVFDDDTQVHHGSIGHPRLPPTEHKRANWEENIEIMSASEHRSHHYKENPYNESGGGNNSGTQSIKDFI